MNIPPRKALLSAILLLTLPGLALAGGKAKKRPPFRPPYDVVTAVDAAAQTVTIGHVNSTNTGVKTYKINNMTEIQVNGQKGTLASVQAGMKASVTPAMDETVVERLVVGPPPPEPKED